MNRFLDLTGHCSKSTYNNARNYDEILTVIFELEDFTVGWYCRREIDLMSSSISLWLSIKLVLD